MRDSCSVRRTEALHGQERDDDLFVRQEDENVYDSEDDYDYEYKSVSSRGK